MIRRLEINQSYDLFEKETTLLSCDSLLISAVPRNAQNISFLPGEMLTQKGQLQEHGGPEIPQFLFLASAWHP